MEAAKSSVKKFMSKSGHHDTEVRENVAPAVQEEQVQHEQHERVSTAVDKEVHQDHYHTTVQPVKHQETLPEQHHHNLVGVEHRKFEHDDDNEVKRKLDLERAKFQDKTEHVDGRNTTTAEPTIAGEHVHHHVHENIQPVVQKQTVEPHVVHTTVPIHEVHHNAAKHHESSALPAMSMDEFKKQGGSLTGRGERTDKFDGCPPEGIAGPDHGHSSGYGSSTATTTTNNTVPSTGDVGIGSGSTRTEGERRLPNSDETGVAARSHGGPLNSHKHDHPQPASYGNDMHPEKTTGTTSNSASTHKPSLMDKLNPKKDANGDGQPGFMK